MDGNLNSNPNSNLQTISRPTARAGQAYNKHVEHVDRVLRSSPVAHAPRIHTMDELRGFAVVCMIFYHAFYSMAYLFALPLGGALLRFFMPAEPWFAGLFILISGISCQLSHSNLARGFKLLAVALALTCVTALLLPDEIIRFGILHFLAVCMILFGALAPLLKRVPLWVGLVVCVLFYILCRPVYQGWLGLPGLFAVPTPEIPFALQFLWPDSRYAGVLYSADYFPLLPWLFIFFAGTFVGRWAKQGRFPRVFYKRRVPFSSWMGRHALVLYVVHQPVIYGLLWVVCSIFGIGSVPALF